MTMLSDSVARERAATAGDRNIVVTAGAGTGKTTLLVSRLLHLILHRPDPLPIGDIVALTFTNKAADEMKLRLRTRLSELPTNELAVKALHELEKSQIGTIHSFAAHLLRLYPIESRVDPGFQQDEEHEFDAFFQCEWALWLDEELGSRGRHEDVWKTALSAVTLEDLHELTRGLIGELIPLEKSPDYGVPPPIRDWLIRQATIARDLRSRHPKSNRLERMLDEVAAYLEQVTQTGSAPLTLPSPGGRGSEERTFPSLPNSVPSTPMGERVRVRGEQSEGRKTEHGWMDRSVPGRTKQWDQQDYDQARRIIRVAQAIAAVRLDVLKPIVELILPFARECRRRFVQTGYISFDGLVARARNLLRDYPHIRRELKNQFRSILVDEFQDTDPVQYEMILYLAEARGAEASDWRRIVLEPGKLFIVGDPKQSIYAFRRADMEAYDAVVEDHVLAQTPPGERHTLHTNFRSHAGLLAPINGFFARVFPDHAIKGIQPRHDPLLSRDTARPLSEEQVEIRLVRPEDLAADADAVGRAEAEQLARWLREEVFERDRIIENGVPTRIRPRHVAILFRTLTDMRDYLEALRRYRIPCLTEGEKHFYERQEVIDVINLLRAAVDPHDTPALVGVLRSSLGAMTDVQIESLARHRLLDYRITGVSSSIASEARVAYEAVAQVYALLRDVGAELPCLPLTEIMDAVLAKAPLMELAAASIDGEQAVANVVKLRDLAVQLARQPALTLRGLVAELTTRALDVPEEAESSLAEDLDGDGDGFVRLLSIHKAKGLEFPMVILAGLQRGANRIPSRVQVHHDWSTGVVGIKVADLHTIGGVYVSAKLHERRRAEDSRVLYVAMTRAKRRLVLSAGLPKQVTADSFLAMVANGFEVDLDDFRDQDGAIDMPTEAGTVRMTIMSGKAAPLDATRLERVEWQELNDEASAIRLRWDERARRQAEILRRPPFLSPTRLAKSAPAEEPWIQAASRSTNDGVGSEIAALIGTLAHRILEQWDFAADPRTFDEHVESLCSCLSVEERNIKQIRDSLHEMLEVFGRSDIYRTLRHATIVGREVPFAIPWSTSEPELLENATIGSAYRKTGPAHPLAGAHARGPTYSSGRPPQHSISIMEGIIDLVYRFNGDLWVADYKTDRVMKRDMADRADEYRFQAQIYSQAVSRALGMTPKGFQFIFLRTGAVVSVLP